jgi:ribonuclease M5
MEERLKIPYPVIVEGKYDKLRLESVIEAQIIPTDGFGVFNSGEKTAMLRTLAKKTPLILLTDSDGAGKLIRSHLTSVLPADRLIQLYVPRIEGKEKRKKEASREGVLGVEGMERALLRELFLPYADAAAVAARLEDNPLSKTDLYVDGLTGGEGCRERRDALARRLGLPPAMTPNAFLAALRILCTYEEYCVLVGRDTEKTGGEQ